MTFQPGHHLRVHRRKFGIPYTHHALMVGDDQVIQFGGSTADKPAMAIVKSPFADFAGDDKVEVVTHTGSRPELAVKRAEWLLGFPPDRRYNAIGFNCEHLARWCATGWETESLQVRRAFLTRSTFVGGPLALYVSWRSRVSGTISPLLSATTLAWVALTIWTVFQYHDEVRRFNAHIRDNCPTKLRP